MALDNNNLIDLDQRKRQQIENPSLLKDVKESKVINFSELHNHKIKIYR